MKHSAAALHLSLFCFLKTFGNRWDNVTKFNYPPPQHLPTYNQRVFRVIRFDWTWENEENGCHLLILSDNPREAEENDNKN